MSVHLVNDVHSQLNATRVERIIEPRGLDAIVETVRAACASGAQLALSGGRHAMGGQQFATDAWLLDMRGHAAIHDFDQERGLITADAGIQWPELIAGCAERHRAGAPVWGIRQKQTDRKSVV